MYMHFEYIVFLRVEKNGYFIIILIMCWHHLGIYYVIIYSVSLNNEWKLEKKLHNNGNQQYYKY